MRSLLALLLIALVFGGGHAQKRESVPMPRILTIGEATVWRVSDNKDQNENPVSPWKEVEVTNVFGFKRAPRIGNRVTVIPLEVTVPLIELTILKIKKRSGCDESDKDVWWEVELEPVKQKEYFEISNAARRAEYPFDVAIIYPAVKFARQIARNELKKAMLPPGTVLDTVKAAIDLTNDGIPDVLILEYCCLDPSKASECDGTCGKTFQMIRNRWKLVDTSSPC